MYKIILNSLNRILAVSSNSTIASKIEFSEDYLTSIGININKNEQTTYLDNSLIEYIYSVESNTITAKINTESLKKGMHNNLKTNCDITLRNGLTLPFGNISRLYSCDILDQLSIMQSTLIAKSDNFCDIKCQNIINGEIGKKEFIRHTLSECTRVNLEMSRFILDTRKKFNTKKESISASDPNLLTKMLW